MFSVYVYCTRMCSGVARGFDGENPLEMYTTFQLEEDEKIYKFPHFLKYKHLCELSDVWMLDEEYMALKRPPGVLRVG